MRQILSGLVIFISLQAHAKIEISAFEPYLGKTLQLITLKEYDEIASVESVRLSSTKKMYLPLMSDKLTLVNSRGEKIDISIEDADRLFTTAGCNSANACVGSKTNVAATTGIVRFYAGEAQILGINILDPQMVLGKMQKDGDIFQKAGGLVRGYATSENHCLNSICKGDTVTFQYLKNNEVKTVVGEVLAFHKSGSKDNSDKTFKLASSESEIYIKVMSSKFAGDVAIERADRVFRTKTAKGESICWAKENICVGDDIRGKGQANGYLFGKKYFPGVYGHILGFRYSDGSNEPVGLMYENQHFDDPDAYELHKSEIGFLSGCSHSRTLEGEVRKVCVGERYMNSRTKRTGEVIAVFKYSNGYNNPGDSVVVMMDGPHFAKNIEDMRLPIETMTYELKPLQ